EVLRLHRAQNALMHADGGVRLLLQRAMELVQGRKRRASLARIDAGGRQRQRQRPDRNGCDTDAGSADLGTCSVDLGTGNTKLGTGSADLQVGQTRWPQDQLYGSLQPSY